MKEIKTTEHILLNYAIDRIESNIRHLESIKVINSELTKSEDFFLKALKGDLEFIKSNR